MLKVSGIDTFINQKKIIKDVSFQITPGSIVGLIGPNGAGKTTIMKTILGLTRFTGQISLDGQIITEKKHLALKEVGALIEHPAVYPFLTGRQNLILYSKDKADQGNIISMLEMNEYIDQKAKNYSLGMKQKLGIAIALLNHPKLVILDEPMNGLDIEATILIRKIIQQYAAAGCAFLISSHILSELQKVMTQIILIKEGRLIIDKPRATFVDHDVSSYRIVTDNNSAAVRLLQENKITAQLFTDYFVVQRESVRVVEQLLIAENFELWELTPLQPSFETTIVKLIASQGDVSNVG